MFWNYRLVRHRFPDGTERLTIHEAYYEMHRPPASMTEPGMFDPDYPRPAFITLRPMTVETWSAEEGQPPTVEAVQQVLEWMGLACDKPVLEYRDFHSAEAYKEEDPPA